MSLGIPNSLHCFKIGFYVRIMYCMKYASVYKEDKVGGCKHISLVKFVKDLAMAPLMVAHKNIQIVTL